LQVLETLIEDIKKSKRDGSLSIFQGLLDSKLPASEKSTERLFCEARIVLAAGTDTTATMMTKLIFHLLADPDVLQKLKAELEGAIPDVNKLPTAAQVENLPWLVSP
jgi:cytochrome P450